MGFQVCLRRFLDVKESSSKIKKKVTNRLLYQYEYMQIIQTSDYGWTDRWTDDGQTDGQTDYYRAGH